jgi:hypothetical protein
LEILLLTNIQLLKKIEDGFSVMKELMGSKVESPEQKSSFRRGNSTYDPTGLCRLSKLIADAFIDMAPYFQTYAEYCANYNGAVQRLNELLGHSSKFRLMIEQSQADGRCRNQDLASLLMKPIQRLYKYPLFFLTFIKNTGDDHQYITELRNAYEFVKWLANTVDYKISSMKAATKLAEIIEKIPAMKDFIKPSMVYIWDQSPVAGSLNIDLPGRVFDDGGVGTKRGKTKQIEEMWVVILQDTIVIASQSTAGSKLPAGMAGMAPKALTSYKVRAVFDTKQIEELVVEADHIDVVGPMYDGVTNVRLSFRSEQVKNEFIHSIQSSKARRGSDTMKGGASPVKYSNKNSRPTSPV